MARLRTVLFVLAGLALAASPALAQGSLTVNPNVEVTPASWTEDVTPGVPSTLVVRITNRAASPDSFRLSATVDANGWQATPELTHTRTLAPAGNVPFPDPTSPGGSMPSSLDVNVSVVPPAHALADVRVPITVVVSSTNSTTAYDTLVVNATVVAVHRVSLACAPARLTLPESGYAIAQLTVANLGNAADEFTLDHEGPGALFVAFAEPDLRLGAVTEKQLVANVTAAPDAEGRHELELRVRSARDPTAGDLCDLKVTVTPRASSSNDSPAAPVLVAVLAAGVAVLARRRR